MQMQKTYKNRLQISFHMGETLPQDRQFVRMRIESALQCSGFSLARKDAIIGLFTNNTRIHHSHGNINPSDTRHQILSVLLQNMARCIKEMYIVQHFFVSAVSCALDGAEVRPRSVSPLHVNAFLLLLAGAS